MSKYAGFLKRARKSANITQEEMGIKMNMSQSLISKLENGNKVIDLETFVRWSKITNMEGQAAIIMFGTDIFTTVSQVLPIVTMFINLII